MEESVRRLGLLVLLLPLSTVAESKNEPSLNAHLKSSGCNAVMTKALNSNDFAGNSAPFSIVDGKVIINYQDSIISNTTTGDTQTIEYEINNEAGVDNITGKPFYQLIRRTVLIKRSGGEIKSITLPQDTKKQALMKANSEKRWGLKTDIKLTKLIETSFKRNSDGHCETDQKTVIRVADESGTDPESIVLFDSAFCKKIQPAISKVGAKNALECGPLLVAAETAYKQRSNELNNEKKIFAAGAATDGTAQTNFKLTLAIAACLTEANASAGSLPYGNMGTWAEYMGDYNPDVFKGFARGEKSTTDVKKTEKPGRR